MATALEVINSDPTVRSIFINIFGGITRGDEVANGIVEALERVDDQLAHRDPPRRHQRRGGPRDPGRPSCPIALIAEPTMLDAARRAVALAGGQCDEHLRRREHQGRRPGPRPAARAASTACATGPTAPRWWPASTPGKGGEDVEGIPVFDTVAEAVAATGANASFISVPPKGAAAAILEAAAAGIPFVVCITEGIPAQDEALVYNRLVRRASRAPGCSAPTAPGSSRPGSATSASPPATSPCPAARSASCSRSGTLTYQALYELSQQGVGSDHVRRHRRRPGPGHQLHRLPGRLRGRPRHQGRHDDRRDRRLGGGGGGRVHRRRR